MTPLPSRSRPPSDRRPPLVVTIDGPAGTGKSSVARRLAERLGLRHLDTGAMYRAAALLAAERGIDPEDGEAIAAAVSEAGMAFDWSTDPPRLLVGGEDVGDRIRDLEVGRIVSQVSAQPAVRAVLSEWQRAIARDHPRLVTEGRDQGSSVFPDAAVRFYLDADRDVRADRRARQLGESGRPVDMDAVRDDIRRRDEQDRARTDAPLVRPEGAVVVDSSDRTLEEVLAVMVRAVQAAMDPDAADAVNAVHAEERGQGAGDPSDGDRAGGEEAEDRRDGDDGDAGGATSP